MARKSAAQGKLEVKEHEYNLIVYAVLENIRVSNWKYIQEHHFDTFCYIKSQIKLLEEE